MSIKVKVTNLKHRRKEHGIIGMKPFVHLALDVIGDKGE